MTICPNKKFEWNIGVGKSITRCKKNHIFNNLAHVYFMLQMFVSAPRINLIYPFAEFRKRENMCELTFYVVKNLIDYPDSKYPLSRFVDDVFWWVVFKLKKESCWKFEFVIHRNHKRLMSEPLIYIVVMHWLSLIVLYITAEHM